MQEVIMHRRFVASVSFAIAVAVVPFLQQELLAQGQGRGAAPGTAAARTAKPYTAPRTENGHPDITGVWSFAVITPFQRDLKLGDRTTLTDQEALDIERRNAERSETVDSTTRKRGAGDVNTAYNDFWYDRGTKVDVNRQSSIVVDPPNGRIPPVNAQGRARQQANAAARKALARGPSDGPEDRGLAERCIIGFNAGPPFAPSAYNNNVQLVQTKDHVVIVNEMVHDARIVPTDGRPHDTQDVRSWLGDSRGRWEGNTLVVTTKNFSPKNLPRGASENLVLTERFTRTAPDVLVYEFTFNDPATWDIPWTGRIPLEKINEPIYEYACHEGNYGMDGILKGTRAEEARAAAEKKN
jgi:hypothetical protein